MVQFKPYSVYVHGSFINEAVFQLLGVRTDADGNPIEIGSFAKQPDWTVKRNPAGQIRTKVENYIISKGYLLPDTSPKALAYERDVLDMLNSKINKSLVGAAILKGMNRDNKVVISPYNSFEQMSRGACNATTSNRQSFDGWIRIGYSPDHNCAQTDRTYPVPIDETLLHELFHAYVHTVGADGQFYEPMKESSSTEEFLAVQVTNMYRAEIGLGVFQRVYGGTAGAKPPFAVSRAELEAYIASDQEALDALNPKGLPLFETLAKYPQLPYNPFRDWSKFQLKRSQATARPVSTPDWRNRQNISPPPR